MRCDEKIAFLYEHPTWSDALLEEFDRRGIALEKINLGELAFNTMSGSKPAFDFAINLVNMMPSAERRPNVVFHTLHYLNFLESFGVRVIDGSRAGVQGKTGMVGHATAGCWLIFSHRQGLAGQIPCDPAEDQ